MKISNSKLHYFNPGHEHSVCPGKAHDTPSAPVRKMREDLSLLPLWYGAAGDYVWVDNAVGVSRFLTSIPPALRPPVLPLSQAASGRCTTETKPLEAAPWGLSPQSIRFFESLRKRGVTLIVPPWKEAYTRLTGRQTAAECLRKVQARLPETSSLAAPLFCTTPEEVRQFMSVYPPPCLLKMPYSCSGRGLLRIPAGRLETPALHWITGALKKQGQVSIEPLLDKACDFAMEFESDGNGQVAYRGLSVFETSPKGSFSACLLGSEETLRNRLRACVPEQSLQDVRDAVTAVLTETLGTVYRGYLGVDMLIYRRNDVFAIHPLIELNLRYTMGVVALQLSRRWMHPSIEGRLTITCESSPGAAYASHLRMEKTYPLQLKDGKIKSGYFSLCPVTPETHYRACILA
ncbi:MAG: hypothetical protein LBP98_07875 [Tannerella sp.]|jgi:hypothetical protein|nr:hypothetical protein [Tannerella sp.]